jgi:antitoxin (DNA-binding transcriptional repressor) of toxin-antitoxin stability system
MTYTLEQAQSNLAQLLAEAREGKEVVIECDDKSAVKLTFEPALI